MHFQLPWLKIMFMRWLVNRWIILLRNNDKRMSSFNFQCETPTTISTLILVSWYYRIYNKFVSMLSDATSPIIQQLPINLPPPTVVQPPQTIKNLLLLGNHHHQHDHLLNNLHHHLKGDNDVQTIIFFIWNLRLFVNDYRGWRLWILIHCKAPLD